MRIRFRVTPVDADAGNELSTAEMGVEERRAFDCSRCGALVRDVKAEQHHAWHVGESRRLARGAV